MHEAMLHEAMLHEAMLYEKLGDGQVRCQVCQRRCVIAPGKEGYCRTRVNQAGVLYSTIYGQVSSMMVSPIEKKPLFHYHPGSPWLSLGSLGCNFRCPGCQNWEIAHADLADSRRATQYLSPEDSVKLAKENNCLGISWTYNEPTIWFEYTYDGAKLAREQGLLTNYVTNGYITPEALDTIGPYLDSFRVDTKGFSEKTYQTLCHVDDFRGILEVTERAKEKWEMWVEIVTNIIPGYNDGDEELRDIASWIRDDLGPDTPWHVTRFVPHLDLSQIPSTPVSTLERARNIGLEAGLRYVYLGNVPGHPSENTYCHNCGKLLIERSGFSIAQNRISDGHCPDCGATIPGRFK